MANLEQRSESDGVVNRNRIGRWIFLISSALGIPILTGTFLQLSIGPLLEFPGETSLLWITGWLLGGEIFARISPNYWVMIPQVQFFVTLNPFRSFFGSKDDPNVIYGPGGDGPSYPWERRSRKSNGTLEVITVEWSEDVPGKDALLLVSGSYQFQVDLRRADRFIGIDESTIRGGIIDLIKSHVSDKLSKRSVDSAKGKIGEFNIQLFEKFGLNEKTSAKDKEVSEFEEEYGIRTVKVTITGIDLTKETQKSRDSIDEGRSMKKAIVELYGMKLKTLHQRVEKGDISVEQYNEMIDRAFALSNNATMNINAFKINNPEQFGAGVAKVLSALKKG